MPGTRVTAAVASVIAVIAASGLATSAADAVPNSGVDPSPSAITSLWAWGNPIDPAADARGLGQPEFQPAALAAFAQSHGLHSVYLSVPWAANQGAFATWLPEAVDALHAVGVSVSALGGDSAWAAQPGLAAQWVTDALATADFDAVQFDVEPWAGVPNPDLATIVPQYTAMLAAAAAVAHGTPIGADLPWWLAAQPVGGGTAFDAILPHLQSVAIVAFSDHATGADGIIALASPAADAAAASGIPFTIGVETDTPAVAGGAQYTFGDDGADALETQTALVRDGFAATDGYRGVTVEHLLSWRTLLGD
ncbi:hypothetical protein [Leifsonia poae]|uniref:hypothetical protein n=1 Tax=Leifsonia poae TaxID=110933 RepID=UPI001CC0C48A|nr:hypothetical protein [Leifsonia poae]